MPSPSETLSYLNLPKAAVRPYQELVLGVDKYRMRVPCVADPDKWTGWDRDGYPIPTAAEADQWCSGCPVFDLCDEYAKKARPAIGVHAGRVYGAGIVAAERAGLT